MRSLINRKYQHCRMHCWLEALGERCTGFLPMQCSPRSIIMTLDRIFFFAILSWAFQAILNRIFTCAMLCGSIKITLRKLFSCSMLPVASQTTLKMVLICAMLSQEYYSKIRRDSFLCNVCCNLSDNLAQGFYLFKVVRSFLHNIA